MVDKADGAYGGLSLFGFIFALTAVIIGGVHYDDCMTAIDDYLLAYGVCNLITPVLSCVMITCGVQKVGQGIHSFVNFIFFIIGCVYVFGAWNTVVTDPNDRENENFCPGPVFNFAAFLVILQLVTIPLIICCGFCAACVGLAG